MRVLDLSQREIGSRDWTELGRLPPPLLPTVLLRLRNPDLSSKHSSIPFALNAKLRTLSLR